MIVYKSVFVQHNHLLREIPMRLYYMTTAKWAEVILKERRLKLSRFYEANDLFELNLIDSRDPSRRKIVKMIEKYHNERTGMICFAQSGTTQ